MDTFDMIASNIEKELQELRKINASLVKDKNSLMKENAALKEQLAQSPEIIISEPAVNEIHDLPITTVFNSFSLDYEPKKARALNVLLKSDITSLSDLADLSICDLLHIRNSGIVSCAIIVIALEHFDVDLKIPTSTADYIHLLNKYANRYTTILHSFPWRPPITVAAFEKLVIQLKQSIECHRSKISFTY